MVKSIQDYISFGYLYLLALGILTESVYYGLLGINFINYTSILDVLLSPLGIMTDSYKMPLTMAVVLLILLLFVYFQRRHHHKNKHKDWYKKKYDLEKRELQFNKTNSRKGITVLMAIMIFSMFIGYGLGAGGKLSSRLKKGELTAKHKIEFQSGEVLKVRILGQTSLFVIYAEEGDREVTAAPIEANIKKIVELAPAKNK